MSISGGFSAYRPVEKLRSRAHQSPVSVTSTPVLFPLPFPVSLATLGKSRAIQISKKIVLSVILGRAKYRCEPVAGSG